MTFTDMADHPQHEVAGRAAAQGAWCVVGVAVLCAGCSTMRNGDRGEKDGALRSPPTSEQVAAWGERDGPDAQPPAGLALVPDAEPRIEPIRPGGPNKPYEALGTSYVPLLDDRPSTERGLATWYGRKFHGRRTSSGEPYDMYAMTAAHPLLPIPSYAKVRNPANGREVVVRINDRGPFHPGRIIDLSYTAALKLGVLRGATPVEVQRITGEDIRTGAWHGTPAATAVARAPQAPVGMPDDGAVKPAAFVEASAGGSPPMAVARSAGASSADQPIAGTAPVPGATAEMVSLAPTPAVTTGTETTNTSPASTAATPSTGVTTAPVGTASTPAPPAPQPMPPIGPTNAARPADPVVHASPTWWLQLGAFRERDAAALLSRQVATGARWLAPFLAVAGDTRWFRLQAGPYASAADAREAADRLRRDLQVAAMVLSRP